MYISDDLPVKFDATTDLMAFHLDVAGVPEDRAEDALTAVRQTVRAMPGASYIDVA